ncbi:MAG: glycyl-radical enzyme activating protein [Clostridia bacterium]|nr:glycyl-radical enzyme activating protein [Clostridia bacterium]
MKNGIVFNIQKFSLNDGPGIRTTVFLKGCPLRCIWCHNPESNEFKREMMYASSKCKNCGKCAVACSFGAHTFEDGKHIFDRSKCTLCGKCQDTCFYDVLEIAGKEMSVEEVTREVMKDKAFYETSNGGVTISGGEPMSQFEFSLSLMRAFKENGLHTAMETCGYAKEEHFRQIAPYTDLFLYDYKLTDAKKHKECTGVDNELILSNLKMLDSMGKSIILRCPIIPTINDTEEHFEGIAKIANELKNILEINIEPYHPLGSGKAENLGREYALASLSFPNDETVRQWIDAVCTKTEKIVKKA